MSFSARVHGQRHRYQARDILSPIESLADSILGITATQSTEQTAATASTTSQTTTTQDDSTITATPQVVTVVPTAPAASSSSPITGSETSSDPTTSSTATVAVQPTTSSSVLTTEIHSTSQSLSASSLISSTPITLANPIQGLSSSSTGSQQAKQENGRSMSTAGLAVAVVFGTLILAGVIYLLYRHFRGVEEKTAAQKPLEYDELKRPSYFGQDAEQGMTYNPGLGLGKVARLKTAPDRTTPYGAQPYRTLSRAASEDTLFLEPTLPVSPLDRREAPLPPLPGAVQESWPIASSVDTPHPRALLVMRPDTAGKAGTGYTPYRPEAEPIIGLAVPLTSGYTNTTSSSGAPLPVSSQTREVGAFERVRQVSSVYELS